MHLGEKPYKAFKIDNTFIRLLVSLYLRSIKEAKIVFELSLSIQYIVIIL